MRAGLEMDEVLLKDQPMFDIHKEGLKYYETEKDETPKLKKFDSELDASLFEDWEDGRKAEIFLQQIELLKSSLATCIYFPAKR